MNKTHLISSVCIALILSITFVTSIFGGAFDNPAIGSKAIGMGTAFTGIADDASAVFYNPGGLVFNKKDTWYCELYTYRITLNYDYTEGSRTEESSEAAINPGFFISKRYGDWALGFGYYIPFAGGGSAYDDFLGNGYDLESSAGFAAVTPAVAYKLRPNLSVGMGLSVYMGGVEREKDGVEMEYDGIAGYGGHISLMYRPTEKWRIGFTARSPVPIEMDGEVKIAGIKYDSEIEFTFPSSYTLGLGYQLNPNVLFSLSLSYRLWGHMDDIKTTTDIQGKYKEKTGYKNSWVLGAGLEYWITSDLAFWAGVVFIQGATKNEKLNAETNDVDMLDPNIGFAYKITDSIEMDFNCVYNYGFEETYDNKKFSFENLLFCLGLRFNF